MARDATVTPLSYTVKFLPYRRHVLRFIQTNFVPWFSSSDVEYVYQLQTRSPRDDCTPRSLHRSSLTTKGRQLNVLSRHSNPPMRRTKRPRKDFSPYLHDICFGVVLSFSLSLRRFIPSKNHCKSGLMTMTWVFIGSLQLPFPALSQPPQLQARRPFTIAAIGDSTLNRTSMFFCTIAVHSRKTRVEKSVWFHNSNFA